VTRLVVVAVILASLTVNAETGLKVRVTPQVSMAPSDVFIYVFVERDPDNRLLRILAQSDDFSRSSDVQLDGEKSARLTTVRYPGFPAGSYEVEAVVIGASGRRQVARASINILGVR
jgi:hypothetical protein